MTVYGWKLIGLMEALPRIPRAAQVVKIHEHEVAFTRALVTPAWANLVGHAILDRVIFDKAFLDGADLGGGTSRVWGLSYPRRRGGR